MIGGSYLKVMWKDSVTVCFKILRGLPRETEGNYNICVDNRFELRISRICTLTLVTVELL